MDDPSAIDGAAEALAAQLPERPEAAVVLGSGLGDVDVGAVRVEIPSAGIPGWPSPSVAGHPGRLSLVGRTLIVRGRVHLYEGRTVEEVVRPVRILARLGVKTLVLTNAAGAIRASFRPGGLMLMDDHINLTGDNPLAGGPNFTDMTRVYDRDLLRRAAAVGRKRRLHLHRGVYAAVRGPSYETPAEVTMLRRLGADAVGMSTVPEAIAAVHAGVRVLGLSVLANRAAGRSRRPLSHAEVLQAVGAAAGKVEALLSGLLAQGWAGGDRP